MAGLAESERAKRRRLQDMYADLRPAGSSEEHRKVCDPHIEVAYGSARHNSLTWTAVRTLKVLCEFLHESTTDGILKASRVKLKRRGHVYTISNNKLSPNQAVRTQMGYVK